MKSGDVYNWLDQGPAVLLERCEIPDVFSEEEFLELVESGSLGLESWPKEIGWKIKLLMTNEVIDVHLDTLQKYETTREVVCGEN